MNIFNWFKSKQNKITFEDKQWVEDTFIWFIEVFGFSIDRLNLNFTLKDTKESNSKNLNDFDLSFFVKQLHLHFNIEEFPLKINIFKDTLSKINNLSYLKGELIDSISFSTIHYDEIGNVNLIEISIGESVFNHENGFILTVCNEYLMQYFIHKKYFEANDINLLYTSSLALIFLGLGEYIYEYDIVLKSYNAKFSPLPIQVEDYANRVYKQILQLKAKDFNVRSSEDEFLNRIQLDDNSLNLNSERIDRALNDNRIYKEIECLEKKCQYDSILLLCEEFYMDHPGEAHAYFLFAFYNLKVRKYTISINYFRKLLKINRDDFEMLSYLGYCQIMLNDLDSAYSNIYEAYIRLQHNSITLRNMGVFYLAVNDYSNALTFLQKSRQVDLNTPLINMYLSFVYQKVEDKSNSEKFKNFSLKKGECNDSIFNL